MNLQSFSQPSQQMTLLLKPPQNKKSSSAIQEDIHNSGTSQKVQEVNLSLHTLAAKCWEPQLCELIKKTLKCYLCQLCYKIGCGPIYQMTEW